MLYQFQVPKETEIEKTDVTKNEKGEEVKTTRKVKEMVPQKFALRKPNRSILDALELFYAVELSKNLKAGILSRSQMAVKFTDEGRTFSNQEREAYITDFNKAVELETNYRQLAGVKEEKNRTPEDKQKLEDILAQIIELQKRIQEFENSQSSLFDQCAETRARNKTILNWSLHLAYNDGDSPTPVFGEGSFDDRMKVFDAYEDGSDTWMLDVIRRFLYLVSFYYMGRAEKKEDFDRLLEAAGMNDVPVKTEVPKADAPKADAPKVEAPKIDAPKA